MRTTYYGEVVAIKPGLYNMYVFKNLDIHNKSSLLQYFTVTKLPNWECPNLEIGDVGYVECEYVNAGEQYIQNNTGKQDTYNYTACYLLHFFKKQETNNQKEFKF